MPPAFPPSYLAARRTPAPPRRPLPRYVPLPCVRALNILKTDPTGHVLSPTCLHSRARWRPDLFGADDSGRHHYLGRDAQKSQNRQDQKRTGRHHWLTFVPALTTRCRRTARARCPPRVGSLATSVVRTPRWTRDRASKSCASSKASSTSLRFPLRRFIIEGSAADGTGLCVLLIGRAARDARRPVGRHPRGSVLLERQRGGLGGEGLPAPSVAVGQRDHHQERGSGRDRKSVV